MPTTQTRHAESSDIDRPTCEQCGSRMWLRKIAHERSGKEFHTFECPVCEVSTDAPR